jgi:hypothetical protein
MMQNRSRRVSSRPSGGSGFEIIRIPKRSVARGSGDATATSSDKPTALATCESGCVRSEIARLVAKEVCRRLPAGRMVQMALDEASAKSRAPLLRRFTGVTVLEGCSIHCASRELAALLRNMDLEVIPVDQFYKLEGNPFGIDDIKPAKLAKIIELAASGILDSLKHH